MAIDKEYDVAKETKYEQRFGEDPSLVQREEDKRKFCQMADREYFNETLDKASKITHGLGKDKMGQQVIQEYFPLSKNFDQGKNMAQMMLLAFFSSVWYGRPVKIEGDNTPLNQNMYVGETSWRFKITDNHWVEVQHDKK